MKWEKKIKDNGLEIIESPLSSEMKTPLLKSLSNGNKGLRKEQVLRIKCFWSKGL